MAGILIALGLFKPQLFLGLLPWLWLGGFGRIVPAFIATAGAIVGITAWFCGAARLYRMVAYRVFAVLPERGL
jgi:hypothetical protein